MNATPIQTTDVTIIGAGPVGLYAIFQCGMLGMKIEVVDALPEIGGQCTALYPEKPIYDVAGFPEVAAADLIEQLEQQAAPFNPNYHLNQSVTGLEEIEGGYRITTAKDTVIETKAIIIAAGAGAFGPNRPPLAGIEDYEGSAVFYAVRRRDDLKGKRIVIAGGGDSAVDWALSLHEIAKRVTVIHRRDKFRAIPDNVAKMRALAEADKLDLVIPYQLHALDGDGTNLNQVILKSMDGDEKVIEADTLLPFFGLATDLGPLKDWGIAFEKSQITIAPSTGETSKPGIFAVGDVATYPGKLKLIVNGFGEAATAAHNAYAKVFPGQALHFEYSTTKGVPGAA
ncbi:MAG: NAD(P)/FAD-dependent oxidoreductase [Alphaproteobacteria bacterium]|nr:NAD(P)/FAD-dependent oxidoreductase [Alphaproteobacteria bacterium SS10]